MANVQIDFSLCVCVFFCFCFLSQETNEIVAIKKFKDSEGETWSSAAFIVKSFVIFRTFLRADFFPLPYRKWGS